MWSINELPPGPHLRSTLPSSDPPAAEIKIRPAKVTGKRTIRWLSWHAKADLWVFFASSVFGRSPIKKKGESIFLAALIIFHCRVWAQHPGAALVSVSCSALILYRRHTVDLHFHLHVICSAKKEIQSHKILFWMKTDLHFFCFL